jgi:hypothetical protein
MAVGLAARGLLACALVLLWAGPAAAQARASSRPVETGREWLARCGALVRADAAASVQSREDGACVGWIEGLIDINEIYRGLGALEKTSEGFCTPPTATVAEAARAVARYFDEHSDALHFSARILAYMALRQAFPCAPPGI